MKRRITTLDEWLNIATRKLSASAKERIRMEIQTHFAEAVAAHTSEGAQEAEASGKALAELGNARAAGRRFRKQYLLAGEARYVDRVLNPHRLKSSFLWNYGMFALWVVVSLGSIGASWKQLTFRHVLTEKSIILFLAFLSYFLGPPSISAYESRHLK